VERSGQIQLGAALSASMSLHVVEPTAPSVPSTLGKIIISTDQLKLEDKRVVPFW